MSEAEPSLRYHPLFLMGVGVTLMAISILVLIVVSDLLNVAVGIAIGLLIFCIGVGCGEYGKKKLHAGSK